MKLTAYAGKRIKVIASYHAQRGVVAAVVAVNRRMRRLTVQCSTIPGPWTVYPNDVEIMAEQVTKITRVAKAAADRIYTNRPWLAEHTKCKQFLAEEIQAAIDSATEALQRDLAATGRAVLSRDEIIEKLRHEALARA